MPGTPHKRDFLLEGPKCHIFKEDITVWVPSHSLGIQAWSYVSIHVVSLRFLSQVFLKRVDWIHVYLYLFIILLISKSIFWALWLEVRQSRLKTRHLSIFSAKDQLLRPRRSGSITSLRRKRRPLQAAVPKSIPSDWAWFCEIAHTLPPLTIRWDGNRESPQHR